MRGCACALLALLYVRRPNRRLSPTDSSEEPKEGSFFRVGQSYLLPTVTQIDGRAVRALKADWKQSPGSAFAPPLSSVPCAAAFYPVKGDDKARTQSLERLDLGC